MDKIDSTGPGSFFFRPDVNIPNKDKDKKAKSSSSSKTFLSLFPATQESGKESSVFNPAINLPSELSEQELNDLLVPYIDTIHQLGDALIQYPSREHIAQYRQSLSVFLQLISDHVYGQEEHKSTKDLENQKKFTLLTRINKKLEDLALGILTNQSSQLQILSKVEEINGLIFDLLH
jgi:uncharacterized protein YaaR (DUF327 family)